MLPLWFWLLAAVALIFAVGAVLGAPYVPILHGPADEVLDSLDLSPGDTVIDLGSGDGAFAVAAAKRGLRVIGYEINPLLVLVSKLRCLRYGKLVSIRLADFWQTDLPPADAVYVFLIERYMKKLDDRLKQQIKQPTQVASYVFAIPGRKPIKKSDTIFLYRYGSAKKSSSKSR